MILAQTICNLPQCTFCKDIDPDSWEWIWRGCWIFTTDPAAGVSLVSALVIGRAYLWLLGRR